MVALCWGYRSAFWGSSSTYSGVLTRMTAQVKYQWVNRSGLEWTDEMAEREDMHADSLVRAAFSGGGWMYGGGFLDVMENHSLAYEEVDAAEVARTGYWDAQSRRPLQPHNNCHSRARHFAQTHFPQQSFTSQSAVAA